MIWFTEFMYFLDIISAFVVKYGIFTTHFDLYSFRQQGKVHHLYEIDKTLGVHR